MVLALEERGPCIRLILERVANDFHRQFLQPWRSSAEQGEVLAEIEERRRNGLPSLSVDQRSDAVVQLHLHTQRLIPHIATRTGQTGQIVGLLGLARYQLERYGTIVQDALKSVYILPLILHPEGPSLTTEFHTNQQVDVDLLERRNYKNFSMGQ